MRWQVRLKHDIRLNLGIHNMIKCRITGVLLLLVVCMAWGCRRKPVDAVAIELEDVAKSRLADADTANVQKRVELALLQWRNGKTDHQPMLLYAILGNTGEDSPQITPLTLCTFDEDADITGFGMREQYVDEKGELNILSDEGYPIYIHSDGDFLSPVLDIYVFAQIRNASQPKNTTERNANGQAEGIDVNDLYYADNLEGSLPFVWVSMPVPGKLDVLVYAIDSAGNQSQPIPLIPAKKSKQD